ncbi:MAG TPA: chemotaxis protein CheW [Candidatus Eisenbacteria bacterium]|nr:chemotaxis protein CheW [Candidatus Eisenbacteria bacterium]
MGSNPEIAARSRGVLVFTIGGVAFGAHVDDVAGLVEAERLAPLPMQREPLAGIVAFRGEMVPAFDLASYLGMGAVRGPAGARFALVLARGGDRVGVVVPEMPRLVAATELRETEITSEDQDLVSLIEVIFEAKGERIHCLNYWSIIDSIMPRDAVSRAGTAAERERQNP